MDAVSSKRILIVEDENDVVDLLTLNLRKAGGFLISKAGDGATGLTKARAEKPDFIILDLMLPKIPGLEVCKIDRVVGLECGADDYVTKPFSPREIVLRIKAILRRGATEEADDRLSAGPITIDPARHEVLVNGKRVELTSLEFKLLRTLMQRRGRVQERDRLLNEVWGYESVIDTRTVDTHVRRLREKLGRAGEVVETVRGFGYRVREK